MARWREFQAVNDHGLPTLARPKANGPDGASGARNIALVAVALSDEMCCTSSRAVTMILWPSCPCSCRSPGATRANSTEVAVDFSHDGHRRVSSTGRVCAHIARLVGDAETSDASRTILLLWVDEDKEALDAFSCEQGSGPPRLLRRLAWTIYSDQLVPLWSRHKMLVRPRRSCGAFAVQHSRVARGGFRRVVLSRDREFPRATLLERGRAHDDGPLGFSLPLHSFVRARVDSSRRTRDGWVAGVQRTTEALSAPDGDVRHLGALIHRRGRVPRVLRHLCDARRVS